MMIPTTNFTTAHVLQKNTLNAKTYKQPVFGSSYTSPEQADERRAIREFADAIMRNRPIRMFQAVKDLVSTIKTPLRETDSQLRFRQARLAITTLKVQAEIEKASGNTRKATALDDLAFLCQAVYDVEEANGGTGTIIGVPDPVSAKLGYATSWCVELPYRDEAIVATLKEVCKIYYGESSKKIERDIKEAQKDRRDNPDCYKLSREAGLEYYVNAGQA